MNKIDKQVAFDVKKNFFKQGYTLDYAFRKLQLVKLKQAIKSNENLLLEALNKDMHKPVFEAYLSEIGFLYNEINHTIKHLKKWMKPKVVRTPLILFPSRSKIFKDPYGTVLIIGPWNYPLQLLLSPLIGAIAAGNTIVIKPSNVTAYTSDIITKLISETFPEE